jgi:FKBP-type peptidyl-prolyl cis-trans isomerase SlyD
MTIKDNKAIEIHYILKDKNGEVLDSSQSQAPLAYIHGKGNIIIGLEKELEGKKVGDKFNATIQPGEAYGIRDEKLVQTTSLTNFKDKTQVKLHAQFRVETKEGPRLAIITKIEDEKVTIDLNHPLAGEELHFEVEVVTIRDATEEEISHGHVHNGDHH